MVDINCDMGEGMANDALLMPFISSANIACGYHAGNADTIQATIYLCLQHKVAIGAHPSFPDRENFGRREMKLPLVELCKHLIDQLEILKIHCDKNGTFMHHVKPHGALYNMAARDADLAAAIAETIKHFDGSLLLYGLSGSQLIEQGIRQGLKTASEVFADRTYQPDGSLTSRKLPNAMVENPSAALEQVLQMVNTRTVSTVNGGMIPLLAETICVHGDGEHAVEIAATIFNGLQTAGISIAAR